jgi:hypothetical protein
MPKQRTWKVIAAGDDFQSEGTKPFCCPGCGYEAEMPFREWKDNPVIAASGLAVIFDRPWLGPPPYQLMPEVIQCRRCRRTYTRETEETK